MCHADRADKRAHRISAAVIRTAMIAGTLVAAEVAQAQNTNNHVDSAVTLDSLIAQAIAASPAIRVAQARVDAARARISPAGTLPDPALMLGVVNLPISHPGFSSDGMTMKMVGVAQTIPFPGKLAARRRALQLDADATTMALDTVRLAVVRNVKSAYYELAYLDHALTIVKQNENVLADVVGAAQSHYTVGTGAQSDVLKAHIAHPGRRDPGSV